MPKPKRRFKVTVSDRETGEQTVFEVFSMGFQIDIRNDYDMVQDMGDFRVYRGNGRVSSVKICLEHPETKTVLKEKKKTKKRKKIRYGKSMA